MRLRTSRLLPSGCFLLVLHVLLAAMSTSSITSHASTMPWPCPHHHGHHRHRRHLRRQPKTPQPRFWFSPTLEQEGTTTVATPTTPMGELAAFFAQIDPHVLEMKPLLQAILQFEIVMRAVGQTQSAKDLHSNIRKVQEVYKRAPVEHRQSMRTLLQFEQTALKAHDGLPPNRLKDPSAAMGLLWIRRSLAFNYRLYSRVIQDGRSAEPVQAALEAYQTELEPFHGWALRRLYTLGIQAATPPRRELLATLAGRLGKNKHKVFLTPNEEKALLNDLERLVQTWGPLLDQWQDTFEELGLNDDRVV